MSILSFFSANSPTESQAKAEPCEAPLDKAQICADVIRFIDLLAEGKYEESLRVAQSGDLPRLTDQIAKLRDLRQSDLEQSVSLSIDINEAAFSGAEMSRAVNEINHRAQGMAAAVEELTTSAASILNTSNIVNDKTNQMKMNVSSGMSAANELLGAMHRIEETVAQSNRKVEELVASTASIDKILYIISDISEKTKLLALNATIEAARAGEAGKGFAVVASEVKTLAAQTATSADEIGQRIKSLVSVTKEISDIMQGVSSAMHEGQEKLGASNTYMNEIHRDSDEISQQMNEVSHNLQEQELASREISSSVATIAEMTHASVGAITRTLDAMDRAEKSLVEKTAIFCQHGP
jgi:methyl-accepting chemotaxis protein